MACTTFSKSPSAALSCRSNTCRASGILPAPATGTKSTKSTAILLFIEHLLQIALVFVFAAQSRMNRGDSARPVYDHRKRNALQPAEQSSDFAVSDHHRIITAAARDPAADYRPAIAIH